MVLHTINRRRWQYVRYSFKIRLETAIQYRAGMALRLVGDMLRLYIKGCIWLALLKDGFSETAAYTLISLLILILTDTRISGELADRVKSGMIAVDLSALFP